MIYPRRKSLYAGSGAAIPGGFGSFIDPAAQLGSQAIDAFVPNRQIGQQGVNYKPVGAQAGQGALKGAATGAAVGSIIPGVGTAIGAGVGAIAGGVMGLVKGQKEKKSALQQNTLLGQQAVERNRLMGQSFYGGLNANRNTQYASKGGPVVSNSPQQATQLPAVNVYGYKDNDTQATMERITGKDGVRPQGFSMGDYEAVNQMQGRYGSPDLNLKSGKPFWNPLTGSLNIQSTADYVQELSHHVQKKKVGAVRLATKLGGDIVANSFNQRGTYTKPGTAEHEAHKQIAPQLQKQYDAIKRRYKQGGVILGGLKHSQQGAISNGNPGIGDTGEKEIEVEESEFLMSKSDSTQLESLVAQYDKDKSDKTLAALGKLMQKAILTSNDQTGKLL